MMVHSKIFKLAFITVLFILFACDQDLSVNPDESETTNVQVTILKLKPQNSLKKAYVAQKWIDSNGGYIIVGNESSGYSYLKFPEGALGTFSGVNNLSLSSESVSGAYIQMSWESENLLQADFFPEGLHFQKPVYIRLSFKDADLTGINESDLAIYYFNPDTDGWELVSDFVNTEEDYVEGYINHFSRYAIGVE